MMRHVADQSFVRTVLRLESHKEPPRLATHHLSRLLGREQLGLLNGPKWKPTGRPLRNPLLRRRCAAAGHSKLLRTMEKRIRATATGAFEFDIALLTMLIGIDALGLSPLSHSFHC